MKKYGQRFPDEPGRRGNDSLPCGQKELDNAPQDNDSQYCGRGGQQRKPAKDCGEYCRMLEHLDRRKYTLSGVENSDQPVAQLFIAQRNSDQKNSGQDHTGSRPCDPPIFFAGKAVFPLSALLPDNLPRIRYRKRQKGQCNYEQQQDQDDDQNNNGVVHNNVNRFGKPSAEVQLQKCMLLETDPGSNYNGERGRHQKHPGYAHPHFLCLFNQPRGNS